MWRKMLLLAVLSPLLHDHLKCFAWTLVQESLQHFDTILSDQNLKGHLTALRGFQRRNRGRVWCLLTSVWQSSRSEIEEGQVLTNLRIFARCSRSGKPIPKRLGIRRRMAESMSLGLFVAPRTRIRSVAESKPSHSLYKKIPQEINQTFEEGEK